MAKSKTAGSPKPKLPGSRKAPSSAKPQPPVSAKPTATASAKPRHGASAKPSISPLAKPNTASVLSPSPTAPATVSAPTKPKGALAKPSAATSAAGTASAAARVAVLDVGHGNSAVLHVAGQVVVVDAGPGSSLLEYLRELSIVEVDQILVSHADKDHIEGILALLGEKITIKHVRLNTDSLKGSELWDDLLFALEDRRLAGELDFKVGLTSGDPPIAVGSVVMSILSPSPYLASKGPGSTDDKGRQITSNSISAVLRIAHGSERGLLLTGDLDAVGLADIERCGTSLDAAVLIYPHHGGRSSGNDRAFAKKLAAFVNAKDVIFSIERAGRYAGNPRPEIVAAVRESLPSARIACTQLSTHCSSAAPADAPTHLLPIYARGRATKACCAGSIVMQLPLGGMAPARASHLAFIRAHAQTALCVAVP